MSEVTIYHNPNCGTSRNVLGLIFCQGHKGHGAGIIDRATTAWENFFLGLRNRGR